MLEALGNGCGSWDVMTGVVSDTGQSILTLCVPLLYKGQANTITTPAKRRAFDADEPQLVQLVRPTPLVLPRLFRPSTQDPLCRPFVNSPKATTAAASTPTLTVSR